jgi:hypothetical protein
MFFPTPAIEPNLRAWRQPIKISSISQTIRICPSGVHSIRGRVSFFMGKISLWAFLLDTDQALKRDQLVPGTAKPTSKK